MKRYNLNRHTAPKSCKDCEYYQPRWRYRFCYFIRCPYPLVTKTLRSPPLRKEHFPKKEVVSMDDV